MTRYQSRLWLVPLCLTLLLGGLVVAPATRVAAGTQHVTACGNAGTGTLRDAIASAAAGDTIVFDQDCTITLASTLTLTKNVTIDGSRHTAVVDGGCTANCGTANAIGGVRVFAVNSGVTVTLSNLTIQHGNVVDASGGGITNAGTLTVTNSTVSGNAAHSAFGTNTYGGGIYNSGTLAVTNTTLSGNAVMSAYSVAEAEGGGIYTRFGGGVTVTNSTFSGNTAKLGGGIMNDALFQGAPSLTVTNSTFSGNSDGIYNAGTASMTNVTLAGNGNGIFTVDCRCGNNSVTTLTNTIVAGNGGDLAGLPATSDHSLIGGNPLLGTLGNYGGPAPTMPLLPGSPALDAGAAVGSGPAGNPVPATDQRGVGRVGAPDIGAYEAQTFTLTTPLVNTTGDGTASAGNCVINNANTCRLRDAIAAVSAGIATGTSITFDAAAFPANTPTTITLTAGALTLPASMVIDGSGQAVVVDGGCTGCDPGGTPSGGVTVFAVASGVTVSIIGLTIQHGNARVPDPADGNSRDGGGIANLGGSVTITNSTLRNNAAPDANGGAIYTNGGQVIVQSSTLSGNRARASGTIANRFSSGVVTVTNSTITGNDGGNAGGMGNNFGTLTVTNSTITGNTASTGGGLLNSGGTLTVTNSTITGNSTPFGDGGGIANFGTATLTNTIVTGNSAGGSGPDLRGAFTGGHNLIGTTSGSTGITNGAGGNIVTPNAILGTLRYNGGPTQTVALGTGSPAIDAGDDAVCAQSGAGKVSGVDQRGITRPQGAHCDIGAFEYQTINPLPPPKPPGGTTSAPNPLPVTKPPGATSGPAPSPLPAPRP